MFLQSRSNTTHCSSGAYPGDKHIDFPVRILPDFLSGSTLMDGRVSMIVELLQNQRTGSDRLQFFGTRHSAFHAVRTGSQDKLRPKGFQQVATLHAHSVRHSQNQFIAFGSRNKSKPHPGISAGRFDNRHTGFQQPFRFRIFYHSQCDTILYTARRIKIFQFDNHMSFQVFTPAIIIQLQQRSVAHQVGKPLCYFFHNLYSELLIIQKYGEVRSSQIP